jgi:hypothetical protein
MPRISEPRRPQRITSLPAQGAARAAGAIPVKAEVGLLGGDLLPQRPRSAQVLAADRGLVHRAVMGSERGVADDGPDGQEDEVGVAHLDGRLGLAAPGLEVDALDQPLLAA